MKPALIVVGCLLLLMAACADESAEETSSPSPLLTADSDRLWILARTARVGDGKECANLYLHPDDPRYQGQAQQCDFWSRNYADYLAINGIPTVEHLHLQEPSYWRWYSGKREQISACVVAVGTLSLTANGTERAEHTRRRYECSPYDHARYNQNQTPTHLGIRFK